MLLFLFASTVAAFGQAPETIDAPRYPKPFVLSGQRSLINYAFDAAGKRITLAASTDTVLNLSAITPAPKLELLGLCDCGRGVTAVFDTPEQRPDPPGGFTHHIQVWHGPRKSEAKLVQQAVLEGGPGSKVRFEMPVVTSDMPGSITRDEHRHIFVSISNSTDYDDVYVLDVTAQTSSKLFSAWDFDVVDLAHDGRAEIVAWQRLTYDLNCNFLVASQHSYPEVYASKVKGYVRVWPPSSWRNPDPAAWHSDREKLDGAYYQLQGTFTDLRHDEKYELIALVNHAGEDRAQWLAAYEFKDGAFAQIAMVQLPAQKRAFMINRVDGVDEYPQLHVRHPTASTTPHVIFRVATPDKCSGGGALDGDGTTQLDYHYAHGELSPWQRYIGAQ